MPSLDLAEFIRRTRGPLVSQNASDGEDHFWILAASANHLAAVGQVQATAPPGSLVQSIHDVRGVRSRCKRQKRVSLNSRSIDLQERLVILDRILAASDSVRL
jgi:hypothetical protein